MTSIVTNDTPSAEPAKPVFTCYCGNQFGSKSTLYRHRKKCTTPSPLVAEIQKQTQQINQYTLDLTTSLTKVTKLADLLREQKAANAQLEAIIIEIEQDNEEILKQLT